MYCTKMCTFWDITLFYNFSQFLRWNSNHFQIELLWFLWGEWTILRLFYWGVYYVKMFIFWDIALISVCIGLSQFIEVKSRPHLNRMFVFFYAVNGIFQGYFLNAYPVQKCQVFRDIALICTFRKWQKCVCHLRNANVH